jgi:hypothetical protein
LTIRDFGDALWRNPVVTLTVIGLTLLTAVLVKLSPPEYEARSAITFLSPQAPFPRNAYASFTPALVTNAEITTRVMASEEMRRRVRAAGGTAEYQVLLANRGNLEMPVHDQPHLTVGVLASSPGEAQRTHAAVLKVMHAQLKERQRADGAEPGSMISWQVTAGTGRAVPLGGHPSRQFLAIGALGAIAALYAASAADRRRAAGIHDGTRRGRAKGRRARPFARPAAERMAARPGR